ncbi:MAG: hormogonium polysaccharide biosynthesis protein HpsA [Spirulinaceae cyanobacterium]
MSQRRQPKPPQPNRPRFAGLRSFFRGLSRFISNILSGIQRRLFVLGRERPRATAGFVLPTVIMVVLVVTLLTLTIVFRSFDRSRNASNVRISQATLEAASPAVERATAKLDSLFSDPRLPRSTPSDSALYGLLSDPQNDDKFTFDDEVRVELAYDFGNGNGGDPDKTINTGGTLALERDEQITTAWKYPVDTDNNGKYDSFTIYSILFRTPEQENDGDLARSRSPIEARTRPMDDGSGSGFCAAALNTSAKLVSQGGWYKSGSKLKKSFFVYTATVPITNENQAGLITANNGGDGDDGTNEPRPRLGTARDPENYETKPNAGFTALEYQQDRARIPLGNYAVVFEDDLAVVSSTPLYLNGSIIANSNLFLSPAANSSDGKVRLYQVSAPISCFYQEENSKVFVGGHLINSPPAQASNQGHNTPVHLFKPDATPSLNQTLKGDNQSAVVGESPEKTVYNSAAYTARINRLVDEWIADNSDDGDQVYRATDPKDVQDAVKDFNGSTDEKSEKRQQALFNHFKNRMRKVPFKEEPEIDPDSMTTLKDGTYQGTGDNLRPQDTWIFPYDPDDGKSSGGYAQIDLNLDGTKVKPPATEPRTLRQDGEENYIGDRIQVGNNLPAVWYKNNQPVGEDDLQEIVGTVWNKDETPPTDTPRGRYTQVKILSDVGDKSRGGFWEIAAATQPENKLAGEGGLRIITGAGVYERKSSFLPPPPEETINSYTVVWPDTMPMSPVPGSKVYDNDPDSPTYQQWVDLATATRTAPTDSIDPETPKYAKGDLKMRASAVYHYAQDIYEDDNVQTPIACVSSYYDPSTEESARNTDNLPNVSGDGGTQPVATNDPIGSNNGVVYSVSATSQAMGGWLTQVETQADLVYPDGRFVNEQLHKAVKALNSGTPASSLSIASQAAIDSTLCALQILSDPTEDQDEKFIKHGWIQEFAFLDPKDIKGNQAVGDRDSLKASNNINSVGTNYADPNNDYNLPIEERQPTEVRVTAINLDELRQRQIPFAGGVDSTSPSPEFLLPNSGIIYASRDDALPDISAASSNLATASELKDSAVDYKLDPTRRPNGIMVYNGRKLGRNNANSFNTVDPGEAEKGLILVTNNPAYVWANEVKGGGIYSFNEHTQEEFDAALDLDPNNPWTNFYDRGDTLGEENPNFACRKDDPRLNACTTGDEWRPATIVSDAIGFLSGNFRFGYRNEGDFDLRNNQDSYYENNYGDYTNPGDITKEARKKRYLNGFLDNNYVTNGLSSGSVPGATTTNDLSYSQGGGNYVASSYFNNFVTPVQRRRRAREYFMEVCPKLPVSECGVNDWYVNYDVSTPRVPGNDKRVYDDGVVGATVTSFNAGTTARPPDPKLQRFPRRVAFQRNPGGQIVLREINTSKNIDNTQQTLVPLGIKGGTITPYPYNRPGEGEIPDEADNALWFVHPNDANQPWKLDNVNPNNPNRLAYLEYKPASEREELRLPDVLTLTPEQMNNIADADNLARIKTAFEKLNGYEFDDPTNDIDYDDPADYLFCIGGTDETGRGYMRRYSSVGQLERANCTENNELAKIEDARTALDNLTGATAITIPPTAPLTANAQLNVYQLPPDNTLTGTLTLERGNIENPIFVFQAQNSPPPDDPDDPTPPPPPITFKNFTLELGEGVNPNNIFWVSKSGMQFDKSTGNNLLAGNFLGKSDGDTNNDKDNNLNPNVGATANDYKTEIKGGRFLGFEGSFSVPDNTFRSLNRLDFNNDLMGGGTTFEPNFYVEGTSYNGFHPVLVPVLQVHTPHNTDTFGNGNPDGSGSNVEDTKWRQIAASSEFNIVFAAGNAPARPGEPDGGIANFANLIEGWDEVNYRINGSQMEFERASFATSPYRPVIVEYNDTGSRGGPFNFSQTYKTGNGEGRVPYTGVPNRLFGYDVGLLSQTPDLFSSRFTALSPGRPDEFFREVGRNDDWVQTLLCAKNAGIDQPAINTDQRPQNFCNSKTGG